MYTVKPRYKEPLYNKNLYITKWFQSLFIVNSLLKMFCNNKNLSLKNKFSSPFRIVKAGFDCTYTLLIHFLREIPEKASIREELTFDLLSSTRHGTDFSRTRLWNETFLRKTSVKCVKRYDIAGFP